MKRTIYAFGVILFWCIGIVCQMSSEGLAIEAYFDTEISTRLEPKKETGTLLVRMLDEEVPPVFPEIVYERVLYTEIIFDASKTMEEPDINGIRKLDIAKKIVSVLVNYFPQRDTRFALRVNGARYSNNCLDSELVVPFSRQNGKQVLEAIKTIQPKGLSPLTYSIRQLFQDFAGTQGTKIVFVVTDGLETCDVEPVDACTVTMDMFQQADFKGSLNIIGINTIYDDAKILLSCLAARGNGEFLDSNRNNSSEFGKLIQNSSQLSYSISKIIDPETLSEGKILELINRRIGDFTTIEGTNVVLQPQRHVGYSSHDLEPGVYKIELVTIPALTSYFTIDRGQVLTIGVVRSGLGLDLYDRAHLALGNRYYDHGQIEEALAEYQKVIKFDDRNVDAHLNLGIIYEDILKDKEKATEHYKAYLELQGPRQEEVRDWLRKIRGEPTTAEELEQKRREREEKKTAEEAKRLEAEKQKQLGQARDKALEVYKDIVTANPGIVVPEEDVISGTVVHVTVPDTTTDLQAQRIAQNIARRIRESLQREPEILIFRQSDPNTPINIPEESSTTPEMVF